MHEAAFRPGYGVFGAIHQEFGVGIVVNVICVYGSEPLKVLLVLELDLWDTTENFACMGFSSMLVEHGKARIPVRRDANEDSDLCL